MVGDLRSNKLLGAAKKKKMEISYCQKEKGKNRRKRHYFYKEILGKMMFALVRFDTSQI